MAKIKIKKQLVASPMPKRIFAQVSPKSIGGVSMFNAFGSIDSSTVEKFQSEDQHINQALVLLREAGFEILQTTRYTINIAASQKIYESAFNTKLITEERPVIKGGAVKDTATFIECPKTDIPGFISTKGTKFQDCIEGIAIEEPRYFMAASAYAPLKSYWHLRVPADISLGVNADKVHRSGITGKGIKIAMVDSGHFRHPFFVKRGYRVAPVVLGPAASNPLKDESGHGTGESANIFAVAPDIDLMPVKINFVNSVGAFNAAVALNPDIITCSWGSSRTSLTAADQVLAAAVAAAWASGIIVIFSAGNGHIGFPGQHPDVISAGGVFMDINEKLQASSYASGFASPIYPNRNVPDVCGLVGMKPKAIYIMLPVEPGDDIDTQLAGSTHPQGDETANNDGWAAFSGTSAAAPQLAGVAALIKQTCGKLKNYEVRDIMMKTAKDVTIGTGANGNTAGPGPDLATGYGLVDANKAVLSAKVRCLGFIRGPEIERGGIRPIERIPSIEPPRREIGPRLPEPIIGPDPIRTQPPPIKETTITSLQDQATAEGWVPLTNEDIGALEDMITNAE